MQTGEKILIDTHCHLYVQEFDADRQVVLERAIEAGINKIMMPNIDQESIESLKTLSAQFPDLCFPMMGLHPCSVREDFRDILQLMHQELSVGTYYGIGETGVDLYWDTTFRPFQIEAFEQQIEWGIQFSLPVIIHSRESLDLNIDIISNFQARGLKGIFHCFSGTLEQAQRIYELGFKIGIGGVVTYKKSGIDEVLPQVPGDMIVLETDAPYLAPVPFRGKRNEPSHLIWVADKLGLLLNMRREEVARMTSRNASEVFTKKD